MSKGTVITESGVTIEGQTLPGPLVVKASDVTVRNCRILTPVLADHLTMAPSSNALVEDCVFERHPRWLAWLYYHVYFRARCMWWDRVMAKVARRGRGRT